MILITCRLCKKEKPQDSFLFRRDEYTCQECGQVGGKLNSHHIKSWIHFLESRYDINNGETLCLSCHYEAHRKIKELYFESPK